MTVETEGIFTRDTFRERVLDGFFADAKPGLAQVGTRLALACWGLDGRCHTQNWEGIRDRVAAFSLPIHLRRSRISKNYAGLHRPNPGDRTLTLEIILPRIDAARDAVLDEHDFSGAEIHELGHPRFRIGPKEPLARYETLIRAARTAKAITPNELLNEKPRLQP